MLAPPSEAPPTEAPPRPLSGRQEAPLGSGSGGSSGCRSHAEAAGRAGGECGEREARRRVLGAPLRRELRGGAEAEREAAGRALGQQGPHGTSPGPLKRGLSCCHGNRRLLGPIAALGVGS